MKNTLILLIILMTFATCQSSKKTPIQQDEMVYEPFTGRWVGELAASVYPDFMSLEIDSITTLSVYYRQLIKNQVVSFTEEKGTVRCQINTEDGSQLLISGELIGKNILSGYLSENGKKYAFNLLKVLPNNLTDVNNFVGFYQIDSGHIVKLTPFLLDETLTGVTILDFKTGKQRVAFPVTENKYVSGNRMLNPASIEDMSFEVTSDSTITFSFAKQVKLAKRLPDLTDIQEIKAKNKNVLIVGSITYPPTPHKKVPLAVLIPGSGETFRSNIPDEYVQILPYLGVATLVYDKRGSGESSGDYRRASFAELAADAVAIIKHATNQNRIDATRLGVITLDQAGYLLPFIAAQLPKMRYAVAISAPVVGMKEQELTACANRMKSDKFLPVDINEALSYQEAMFDYLDGKTDSATFQKLSDSAMSKPWKGYVTLFEKKEYIDFWRINKDFNPENAWKNYRAIPLLALYGHSDRILNVSKNASALQAVLPASSKKEIKIMEKANHLLILGASRGDIQLTEMEGYAPETFRVIAEWVLEHTK